MHETKIGTVQKYFLKEANVLKNVSKTCVINNKKIVLLDVYSLCVAYPEPLADRLYGETKKFLEDHVTATLAKVKSGGEQSLLANYHSAWQEFSK